MSTSVPDVRVPRPGAPALVLTDAKRQLRIDLYELYFRTKEEIHYVASRYAQMVDVHDPVQLVERMVLGEPTQGFHRLIADGRYDITIEFMICNPSNRTRLWWEVIPDEWRATARQRLSDFGVRLP